MYFAKFLMQEHDQQTKRTHYQPHDFWNAWCILYLLADGKMRGDTILIDMILIIGDVYSVLPFTDRNKVLHHRVIDVPTRASQVARARISEIGQKSKLASVSLTLNFDESMKMFSDELFASVVNGVFDPPANMTPRIYLFSFLYNLFLTLLQPKALCMQYYPAQFWVRIT